MASETVSSSTFRRILRILTWTIALVLLVATAVAAVGWIALERSLPILDGNVAMTGLTAPVGVERDGLGVVTVRASNRADAARALGFVHAQDRFFQMDLLRRQPAGELSELFGARALESDEPMRVHRFRARARRAVAALAPHERRLLDAYADGVNAGLAALKARPFEYLVLRTQPAPWRGEDSFLAVYAMYLDLQDGEGHVDSNRGVLREVMPPEMYAFLSPQGSAWDAPIDGSAIEATHPIPGPEVFDLRVAAKAAQVRPGKEDVREHLDADLVPGSNNFAVDARAGHGRAFVAGDMHLNIRVPGIWYRASIAYRDDHGTSRQITGVTLPGTPFVVAGSNGSVAWAFTNSFGDWSDLVVLDQSVPRATIRERIRVKGGDDRIVEVRETPFGPVIDKDHHGRERAIRWVAHHVRGLNAGLAGLERAATIDEAVEIANRAGIPNQNFVVADRGGRIGWTLTGAIPRHPPGWDGRFPVTPATAWREWLDASEYPRVIDPPSGRIWTANARVVGGEMLEKSGDGGYAPGARGRQIREGLQQRSIDDEKDLLAIQLDTSAMFLARWQKLLLQVLSPEAVARNPKRAEMRRLVEQWGGKASVESAGYRLVRAFRGKLDQAVYESLTAPARAADQRFDWRDIWQREPALWALATEKPQHLLDPRYRTWDEQLLAAADAVIADLTAEGRTLTSRTWGERNTSRFRHPLASAVPLLGRYLEYAPRQLPGDSDMPRVQGATFGASQRMVISPGRESQAIFHMPGGQSGHPLSPHFADSHDAWAEGRPTPFLPGRTVNRLTLQPLAR